MYYSDIISPSSYQGHATIALGEYRQHPEVDDATMTMANFAVPLIQQHIKSDSFFKLKSVDKVHKQVRIFNSFFDVPVCLSV